MEAYAALLPADCLTGYNECILVQAELTCTKQRMGSGLIVPARSSCAYEAWARGDVHKIHALLIVVPQAGSPQVGVPTIPNMAGFATVCARHSKR
jgi:hypothetical protein